MDELSNKEKEDFLRFRIKEDTFQNFNENAIKKE